MSDWREGRRPFRYEPYETDSYSRFIVRDCDDLWIALVPLEEWAKTIVALLNSESIT